jgi:hypothetical protein
MSSGAALVAASDLKVAGVMGIFEAAIGVPALKAVSRLISLKAHKFQGS